MELPTAATFISLTLGIKNPTGDKGELNTIAFTLLYFPDNALTAF
jgi:hypothetical protein